MEVRGVWRKSKGLRLGGGGGGGEGETCMAGGRGAGEGRRDGGWVMIH